MRAWEVRKPPPKKKKTRLLPLLAVVVIAGVAFWLFTKGDKAFAPEQEAVEQSPSQNTAVEPEVPKVRALKAFTAEEFRQLYETSVYPNLQALDSSFSISGNPDADKRIRRLAEARGYEKRGIPVAPIYKIGEEGLTDDDLLQEKALVAWQELKKSAHGDGIPLTIISGYRSPEYQRDLFMERLRARGVTPAQVAAGQADAAVNDILRFAAIPGYSRHHTGYAIDLACKGNTVFENSECFQWISKDNYQKAKEAGWVPSYPEGLTSVGPEPEPWEYVWVGKEALYE